MTEYVPCTIYFFIKVEQNLHKFEFLQCLGSVLQNIKDQGGFTYEGEESFKFNDASSKEGEATFFFLMALPLKRWWGPMGGGIKGQLLRIFF